MSFFHLDAVIESFFSENPEKLHKNFIHTAVASVEMRFHQHLKTFRSQIFQTDDQFSYFHGTGNRLSRQTMPPSPSRFSSRDF